MAHDTDDGPTFEGLTAYANDLLATNKPASLEQETALRSVIDKLLDSGRESAPIDGESVAGDDGGE